MTDVTAGRWRVDHYRGLNAPATWKVWRPVNMTDFYLVVGRRGADRLAAQLDALAAAEAKAALADDLAEELAAMVNQYADEDGKEVGWRKRLHDPARNVLARYTTLTEATQPKQRMVCKHYPTPGSCPLPNVHCQAPDCMVPEATQQGGSS